MGSSGRRFAWCSSRSGGTGACWRPSRWAPRRTRWAPQPARASGTSSRRSSLVGRRRAPVPENIGEASRHRRRVVHRLRDRHARGGVLRRDGERRDTRRRRADGEAELDGDSKTLKNAAATSSSRAPRRIDRSITHREAFGFARLMFLRILRHTRRRTHARKERLESLRGKTRVQRLSAAPTSAPARCATWFTPVPRAALDDRGGGHLRLGEKPLHHELPQDDRLQELARVHLGELGQHGDGEEPDPAPTRRGKPTAAAPIPSTPRLGSIRSPHPGADAGEQVGEPDPKRALLLLDDVPEHVEDRRCCRPRAPSWRGRRSAPQNCHHRGPFVVQVQVLHRRARASTGPARTARRSREAAGTRRFRRRAATDASYAASSRRPVAQTRGSADELPGRARVSPYFLSRSDQPGGRRARRRVRGPRAPAAAAHAGRGKRARWRSCRMAPPGITPGDSRGCARVTRSREPNDAHLAESDASAGDGARGDETPRRAFREDTSGPRGRAGDAHAQGLRTS